jgi:mono/diheme cytochrome c family protein
VLSYFKTEEATVRFSQVATILAGAALAIGLGYQVIQGEAAAQSAPNTQVVERGRYIVDITGCNDCHTVGYAEAGGKAPESEKLKGDTLGYRGPWGTTYPTNLRLTVSKLTEDQWVRYGKNLMSRPPMPWFNVRAMSDADLRAMYQYIKSLGAPGNAAPPFLPPDKPPKPPFIQWPGVK